MRTLFPTGKVILMVFTMLLMCAYEVQSKSVPKKSAEDIANYRRAAEQGEVWAQCGLGMVYRLGEDVPKDLPEAAKWFRNAADQGYAIAQRCIGHCYASGEGVEKDTSEAVKWYQKSAMQGDAWAQYHLGICFGNGTGIPKDSVAAAKWFRKSADQNISEAQYILGLCFIDGLGVRKDFAEAAKWFRKAAGQGHPEAQYSLGLCYDRGNGVPEDFAEAAKWYHKAADQGDAKAQCALGLCYKNGEGVAKNDVEAAKWWRKSAVQGDSTAQFNLGNCYAFCRGVPKDKVEAYKWWLLAAGQGLDGVRKNIAILGDELTREQIAEGQKLARDFKPKKLPKTDTRDFDDQIVDSIPTITGTGFFITESGFLITNNHVVQGANQVRLASREGVIVAKVVKVDSVNDLALLKAEGKFWGLPVTTSRKVKLGSSVATVGFPNIGLQGFAPKLAKGEIASLSGAADDARYFQISVPVQPGNSGGALVDERGNVVGVVSAKLNAAATLAVTGSLPENVNYAIKSSFLLGFLESVPNVANELKEPNTLEEKFENVVKSAEQAAVLVLVY